MIAAGIGCRRDCPAEDILAAIAAAAATLGQAPQAIAAPHFKRHEPGLLQAAARLGLPLLFIDDPALSAAQPHCPTRSAIAQAATGHASIAEAAAIAAAGPLLLPRLTKGAATCALAGTPTNAGPGPRAPAGPGQSPALDLERRSPASNLGTIE